MAELQRFDVAVVGAGAAGLACVIEAAEAGATVALIDASHAAGGTARVAGGGSCIAGSPLQRELGIRDSPDLALGDWIAWGGTSVDVPWAERYLRATETDLFERLASAGVKWMNVLLQEGNRVARWHQPAGGGAAVMDALEKHARTLPRVTWLLGHRATHVIQQGGVVTGVVTKRNGWEMEVSAGALVIASGGFNNNHSMVREQAVEAAGAERILLGGGVTAVGEGHRMLNEVGAQFTQLDAVWMNAYGTPDYLQPDSHRGVLIREIESDLWINDDGQRFHNEALRGGATGTAALLGQPLGRCWSLFDARIAARMTIADPHYRHRAQPIRDRIQEFIRDSPYVVSAPTIDQLAARMEVEEGNVRGSVAQVNAAIAEGMEYEPAFGKPLKHLQPVEEAPFYAVRFYPLARKNLGGVRTDLSCRVLDTADAPIEGLFAAGEVAGMAGGRINGRASLEGTSVGPCLYSGMVAGRSILE